MLLFHMPFAAVSQPSIALGLLKAGLTRQRIPCDVEYANIAFAERIGVDFYDQVSALYNAFIGEWLFSVDLFRDRAIPDEKYVNRILRRRYAFGDSFIGDVLDARRRVAGFLDTYVTSMDWDSCAVVGFTSNYQQTTASLALARRIKENHPHIAVVIGGANCEAEMGAALFRLFPFLDAVFSGESDETFVTFVHRILADEPVGELAGVLHRLADGPSIPARLVASVSDLDTVPAPDYDDYFRTLGASSIAREVRNKLNVWAPSSPQTLVQTSRGCWWGEHSPCTFCSLNGRNMHYRSKSPQRVVEELAEMHEKYSGFLLVVDNVLDPRYVTEAFPQLRSRCPGVGLFYETKADLDRFQLQALKNAGVVSVQPGLESLSTGILQLVGKGTTLLTNLQILKWCKELGMGLVWPYLWGFPGEEPADYQVMVALIDKIRHLPPPNSVIKVQLHRFSPYFAAPEKFGIANVKPHPSYRYIYPFPQSDLFALAYYFTFDYADGRDPASYARPLVEAVTRWQREHRDHDLAYRKDGDRILVRATGTAGETTWRLGEVHAAVFEHCDAVRTLASVRRHVHETVRQAISDEDVTTILDDLVKRNVLATEGQCYLTLATRNDMLPCSAVIETLG